MKLLKNLSETKYFKILKSDKKLVSYDKYDLIINTDYSNLFTKKYFNKKIVKMYNSLAYTTIIKHDEIFNETAFQIFTKNGPLAFLPASKTETSIVYSINKLKIMVKGNYKFNKLL